MQLNTDNTCFQKTLAHELDHCILMANSIPAELKKCYKIIPTCAVAHCPIRLDSRNVHAFPQDKYMHL